jgi:molybdate transport system substrate-binding protein
MLRTLILSALMPLAAEAGEVTVFAAASLKTALDEVAADWEAATGNTVVLSYGGSPAMARQIEAGAPADVYISAAVNWMDYLQERNLIQQDTRRDLLRNTLALVSAHPDVLAMPIKKMNGDILRIILGEEKLSMALVDSVPAGQYGKEALISLGIWDEVKDQVVQSENVTQAVRLVEIEEARLGIAYVTDVVAGDTVDLVSVLPSSPIIYPAALTTEGTEPEPAAFLDYLESPEADAVFVANGFKLLP